MKLAYDVFPTHWAKSMAHEVGLLSDMETDYLISESEETLKLIEEQDRLIEYQQMALSSDLESCLVVYHGIKLSKAKIKALKTIHENTPKMLVGATFSHLTHIAATERDSINPDSRKILNALRSALNILRSDTHEAYLHH